MKFYLCSAFARATEMEELKFQVESLGHKVTSTWHCGAQASVGDMQDSVERLDPSNEFTVGWALKNFEDLDAADCLVFFSSKMREGLSPGRGGRHTEFGYAFARAKGIVIIGPREVIFHSLITEDQRFPDWPFFLTAISRIEPGIDMVQEWIPGDYDYRLIDKLNVS